MLKDLELISKVPPVPYYINTNEILIFHWCLYNKDLYYTLFVFYQEIEFFSLV